MAGTILVVEDQQFMQMLIEQSLEDLLDEGWEIHFSSNGEDGISEAIRLRPSLILMDVMMPKVDGFEACRSIRAAGLVAPDVRIVMLTARGQHGDLLHGQEVGADAYITKPFDTAQLLSTCRRFLSSMDELQREKR